MGPPKWTDLMFNQNFDGYFVYGPLDPIFEVLPPSGKCRSSSHRWLGSLGPWWFSIWFGHLIFILFCGYLICLLFFITKFSGQVALVAATGVVSWSMSMEWGKNVLCFDDVELWHTKIQYRKPHQCLEMSGAHCLQQRPFAQFLSVTFMIFTVWAFWYRRRWWFWFVQTRGVRMYATYLPHNWLMNHHFPIFHMRKS